LLRSHAQRVVARDGDRLRQDEKVQPCAIPASVEDTVDSAKGQRDWKDYPGKRDEERKDDSCKKSGPEKPQRNAEVLLSAPSQRPLQISEE
jgi:hypothetical protein